MKEITGKITGVINISEDTTLRGILVGPVTVQDSSSFIISGTVVGNLHLDEGTETIIRGTINGDVINQGGKLEVYGMVDGTIYNLRGDIFIDPDAIIDSVVNSLTD